MQYCCSEWGEAQGAGGAALCQAEINVHPLHCSECLRQGLGAGLITWAVLLVKDVTMEFNMEFNMFLQNASQN